MLAPHRSGERVLDDLPLRQLKVCRILNPLNGCRLLRIVVFDNRQNEIVLHRKRLFVFEVSELSRANSG